jgi:hypothetical protein
MLSPFVALRVNSAKHLGGTESDVGGVVVTQYCHAERSEA